MVRTGETVSGDRHDGRCGSGWAAGGRSRRHCDGCVPGGDRPGSGRREAAECLRAGTVHLGGTLDEIAASERAVWRGEHPEQPCVLFVQQTPFDPSRAPEGKHTAWAYCHVPHGSPADMTGRIEAQIERFAPGFRNRILARATRNAVEMERYNPNYIGGDINGGVQDLTQLFTRPVAKLDPYATPSKDLYLCSSATPPGGVHGMCGYFAAQSVLKRDQSQKKSPHPRIAGYLASS